MNLNVRRMGLFVLGLAIFGTAFTGCNTLDANNPQLLARQARIASETPGDYYIGRRYWLQGTRFWGFLRKPGQQWSEAKLVMMNEAVKHTPDRLPESNPGGNAHGYDHNYEYRITGRFTGHRIYDLNSNQILPEFQLADFQ